MVGYDSIIPPGRVGLVTESVNLSNYHAGSYTKSATITSWWRSFATSMRARPICRFRRATCTN